MKKRVVGLIVLLALLIGVSGYFMFVHKKPMDDMLRRDMYQEGYTYIQDMYYGREVHPYEEYKSKWIKYDLSEEDISWLVVNAEVVRYYNLAREADKKGMKDEMNRYLDEAPLVESLSMYNKYK